MLDISPILLLSSGIVFLLVLARLNSCLYKPLFKHMDERTESIAKDLENAKSNGANIEGMLVEAKEIIAKAKSEASLIREKATKEAQEIADTKLKSAKTDLGSKYDDFVKSLDVDRQSLKASLESAMPLFKDSLKAKISSI